MVNFLIPTIACGCCFLMFLFIVVLSVIARVLGLGRKRKVGAKPEVQAEVHSDEKGPVVDAEFKDVEGKGDERAKDVNPHDSHQP